MTLHYTVTLSILFAYRDILSFEQSHYLLPRLAQVNGYYVSFRLLNLPFPYPVRISIF